MRRLGFATALAAALAACGVRTPARVDVDAILRAKGREAARIDLEAAVLAAPRDVGAHLALAALADKLGRPSEAIEQLEIVGNLGGPLGIRWHDEDRALLARLIAARGQVRLARGAASAAADLERARGLGAVVPETDLRRAHIAAAIADLRHIDAGVRERGAHILAFFDEPQWHGARPNATLAERAAFGAWLWSIGAKRGAWVELSAWHDRTPAPRDPALQAAYFTALMWWRPVDARFPPDAERAGPERCRFGDCRAAEVAARDDVVEAAALLATGMRSETLDDSVAWVQIGLRAMLRGGPSWGRTVKRHVDIWWLVANNKSQTPPEYLPFFAMISGGAPGPIPPPGSLPIDRLVVAAERALAGDSVDQIRATLGPLATTADGAALLALFAPREAVDDPVAVAIVRAARARVDGALPDAQLAPIVAAFRRDPAIADRLGRDRIAAAEDAAIASATLGALFETLGDPARARLAWQAAYDASPEPAFAQGLAEIQARAGDPDAAMITATASAAASGDPSVSWIAVARALHETGSDAIALDAARSAIDLATADTIDAALRLAIDASRALGRDAQAAQLGERRAAARHDGDDPAFRNFNDPIDAAEALAVYRETPTSATLARLWVGSRWSPRDVSSRAAIAAATSADDPRHTAVIAELVELAGDRALAADALHALRSRQR